MHPHEFLRHYPHEFMIQQAYEDMELASRKPTFGQGSSPKQNIIENAMAMLQFPEFKMFSKKDYVRFVWNEGHKNQDLLYISPRKGIDRRMKKVIKTWGKVLRNPLKRNGVLQQWKNNPIMPRNYLAALNKGWSGPPWWTISPTISAHHLTGNPPDDDEGESYEFEVDVDLDEEDAKQLAYDMAADSEFRETMQSVATEGEKTFYLMVKKVEAGYQFIISPDKDPNADLIDVVEPAIVKFRDDWRRSLENPTFKVIIGDIITVSGPSSSGKSAISKTLSKKLRARMVPSYMSRERRPSEVEGVDGIFISKEKFQDLIDNGAFTTKDGVELWVKQKSGEYYGRKVSDFMQSTTAIVDVNFEGLRLMRKAFPGRTYSVFIRTNMGPKRRRENLEKRGVHSEEEIEARVRAGTGMLETFQNLNFDFIARNKYGELDKNVAMIAAEFKKAKKNPPAKTTAVYIGPANHLSVAEVIDAEHFVLIDSGPNHNYAGGPEETDEGKNWFMEQLYDMAGALNFTIVHQERKLNKDGAAVIRFTTPKGRTIDYYYNTVHPFAKGQDIPAIREALHRADSLIIAGFHPHKAILDEMPNLETIFLYDQTFYPVTIQEAAASGESALGTEPTLIESLFHRSDLTYTVMSRDEDPDAYYGKAPITDQFIELGSKGSFGSYSEAASAAQAADAAWKISDGPSNNPPAEDVQWTVNVTTQLPKAKDWLFGHSVPAAKAEYISAWILLTGKNADGEVKMILSVMEDLDRVVNKLLPSLFRHKTETEKMGLTSFAMVEQIETKSRGKGLGQAAYLKAAEYTMNEFGAPLITGNHSLSAEKAWRGVERNLPEGYKVVKWIGGEYQDYDELEIEDPFSYHRVLWYGPRIAKRKNRKYSNKVCPHPEKNAYQTKKSAEQNISYDKRHLVRAYKCPIDGKAHWHLTSSITDNPSAKGINLRTIMDSISERSPRFFKSMTDRYSHALKKPRRPKKRTLESSLKMRWAQGLSAEEIEEIILQRYRNDIKHYRNKLRNWKRGQEKRIKYYGYSGTSGKKLLSIVLDTLEKEFKGRATITAYRAIFAFNSGKKDIVDWLKMHGTGDYYSTWKRGADIYFPEFSKGQNWLQVPGAVAWLITAEISILDINWNRTLRNRLNYPEEKELSIGLPLKGKKINRLIKRVDVYDLNQAAKYSTSDSTGQGKQPWLSTKVKPIASYEFKGLKANSPSQDAIHQETLEKTGFWGAQGAGCIVMAKSTGRFLLPLRSQQVEQPGTWGVWGGAIDSDEIPMEAAKRELTEEAGYGGDISMKPLVMYSSGSFRYHNFLAVVDEEFEPTLDWETEKAGWFELKDFPEPLHFGLIYLLANSMKQIVEAQSQEEVAEVPRFLYHGSPVAGLKIIEARLDPVFAKKWKESNNKGEPPKTVFFFDNPSEAEWYALGGYQSMKHSYTDGSDKSFRDKIAQKTMDQPTPGVIYRIKTEGIDGLVPLGHNAWVVFNQDVSVHDYKSIKEYTEAGIEWARSNPPVFDGEGAMNMGFQHEGTSRYHGHPLPGGSEIPAISGKWKKKSFPSGSEMPLSSKQESDGTYTMGFLERFEDDDRPYIVSNKIDGDSSIAHFDGKETVLWNKRGRWRKDYHLTEQITASLQKNGVKSAIILGELYAVDEKGDILPFKEQTRHITAPKDIETQNRARFAAYDMAQVNGKDIQDEPYASRMELLKPLIKGSAVKVVQFWRSRGGMGDILLAWDEVSKNPHFEGLVVRFDGDKKSFKVKMTGTADLAVIGFYRGREGGRLEGTIGGGTLAWMDEDGNYVVAGNSVIGESLVKKDELLKRLLPTAIDAPKVKWGDHLVDRSITHDHRGKGTITAIEPFLIGEFKYRSINYSEKPVYRLENDRFIQVGTKRAPTLQQATFGRWRPDKELTPHDLRMGQVAEEGQGKWLKNPHKKDSQYAWWEPDEKGHRIFNNSNSLQFIREQLVGNRNISRREVFDMVAYGIEEKYGVQYQTVSEEEARKIPYLRAKQSFYGPYVHGKSNYGTWDEDNGIVYFNENMFNDRSTALMELGHETGAVIIASQYGGKGNIPKMDGTAMNQKMRLTHLVDKYTFGELEPAPGAARKLVLSNPPAMGLEWEHRVEEIKGREHQTLFGRDETGGGVAVRWNMELLAGGNRRAMIESIGLGGQVSMAIDSGVFNGKRLTEKEMRALEDLDILTPASLKGKGYGQAAYLKILDYADEVYSFGPSTKATRAWDALEKRQKELGITIEKIPKKYGKGFTRLLKRVKANPPEEEDETEYPGGTSQYLMDGIIIGSLKHRQGGPYLGWPGGPNIQRIGWQIQYPELEARLEEAKKRGWTGEGMALPKMGTDIWEKSWAKNPPAIKSSNRVNIHIPKIISMKWYTEATLKSNRDKLFLFGDNEARKGKGGQAEYCRGKPNAMGIRTKKSPSLKDGAFWTDKNYQENIKMMADDFMAVFDAGYETIVLPTAGIGTGLAQLKDRAPKTYRWLSSMMKQLSALEE
jgi:guanylate kinase/8-oxo-dGTP pyrophosphatase MutT (NUDIX family)